MLKIILHILMIRYLSGLRQLSMQTYNAEKFMYQATSLLHLWGLINSYTYTHFEADAWQLCWSQRSDL